jgi:hypothetical protein
VQAHARGCRQDDDGRGTFGLRSHEQVAQRLRVIRAGTAPEEAFVLRRQQHPSAVNRRPRKHDPVVAVRRDTPALEMQRGPWRVEHRPDTLHGARIRECGNSLARAESFQRDEHALSWRVCAHGSAGSGRPRNASAASWAGRHDRLPAKKWWKL